VSPDRRREEEDRRKGSKGVDYGVEIPNLFAWTRVDRLRLRAFELARMTVPGEPEGVGARGEVLFSEPELYDEGVYGCTEAQQEAEKLDRRNRGKPGGDAAGRPD